MNLQRYKFRATNQNGAREGAGDFGLRPHTERQEGEAGRGKSEKGEGGWEVKGIKGGAGEGFLYGISSD